jgi:hypothetical protein
MPHARLVLLAAVLLAAACSQQPAPADTTPAPVPAAPAAVAAPAAPAVPASLVGKGELLDPRVAFFEIDPGVVFACEGRDRVTSEARWKINDPAVTTVELQVNTPDDTARKTFATEPGTGVAHTRDWVVGGMSFYLVEQSSGKDLARYVIASRPCE